MATTEDPQVGQRRNVASRLYRQQLFKKLEELPLVVTVMLTLVTVAAIGFVDVFTGNQVSLSIFYLTPVFFAVWFGRRSLGILAAVTSTLTWATIELITAAESTPLHIRSWNTALRFGFFMVVLWLLDDVKHAHTSMEELSRTDSLTGLCNHGEFYRQVEDEIQRSRRRQRAFTIAYIDVDGFKSVNDTLGHYQGDAVLRLVARTLRSELRSVDVIGRLGGDEFAILMPETGLRSAPIVLNRLTAAVTERLERAETGISVLGFSIGAVAFYAPPVNADVAISLADRAMYEGRHDGVDGVNIKVVTSTFPGAVAGDELAS